MELKKEYFKRYEPSLWFKVKSLFAKTKKAGEWKYKVVNDKIYVISIKE